MAKQHETVGPAESIPGKLGSFIAGSLPSWGTFLSLMYIYTSLIRWQDRVDSSIATMRKDVDTLIMESADQNKRTTGLEIRSGLLPKSYKEKE